MSTNKGPSVNTSSLLFFLSEKIGGEGVETSENLKLEGKLEGNGGG